MYFGCRGRFEGCWQLGCLRRRRNWMVWSTHQIYRTGGSVESDVWMDYTGSKTHRKKNVPTNSPAMAMKWLRRRLGSLLKKEAGLGKGIFSDPTAVWDLLGSFRLCGPKSPGRNPDLGVMLSMSVGKRCLLPFPKLNPIKAETTQARSKN